MSADLAVHILSRQVDVAEEEIAIWKAAPLDAGIAEQVEGIIRLAEGMTDGLAGTVDSFDQKALADKLDPSGPSARSLRRVVHHSLRFLGNVRAWADSLAERG